jgi:hypothetical protein
LKIFWTDQIGAKEIGHSVIYLGHRHDSEGVELVRYWSSNKKGAYAEGGYGKAEVPLTKIKQMLFSRLEDPNKINNIGDGLKPDEYLASMLINSSTPEEMKKMVGIRRSARADPIPVSSVSKEKGANGTDLKVDREKKNETYVRKAVCLVRAVCRNAFSELCFSGCSAEGRKESREIRR